MSATAWITLILPVVMFLGALFLVSRKSKRQLSAEEKPTERGRPTP